MDHCGKHYKYQESWERRRKLGEGEKAGSCKLESEGRKKEVSKYLMHHAKYLMMCGRVWEKGAETVRKGKITNGLEEPLRFKGTLESETIGVHAGADWRGGKALFPFW